MGGCSDKKAADGATGPSSVAPGDASATAAARPEQTTASPRTTKWTALKAGDCLAEAPPTDPAVVTVTLVDCSTPHLAETYLRADIPVDAALNDVATSQCDAGFTRYTGGPVATSPYAITYLIDSDQDRTYNNPFPSTVICLLQNAGGQTLTGSARG
ncbi:MAG: hypothetical protein KDB56_17000 [Mycobacterium sp.]|nr:hypothetical protein [Mycobacterium sp.]